MKVRDILNLMTGDHIELVEITRDINGDPNNDIQENVLSQEEMAKLIVQPEYVDYKEVYKDYLDRDIVHIYTSSVECIGYSTSASIYFENEEEPTIVLEMKQ